MDDLDYIAALKRESGIVGIDDERKQALIDEIARISGGVDTPASPETVVPAPAPEAAVAPALESVVPAAAPETAAPEAPPAGP